MHQIYYINAILNQYLHVTSPQRKWHCYIKDTRHAVNRGNRTMIAVRINCNNITKLSDCIGLNVTSQGIIMLFMHCKRWIYYAFNEYKIHTLGQHNYDNGTQSAS